MTMPREIYCGHVETTSRGDEIYHCTKYHLPNDTKYYSQAVIDEKDARIKELELLVLKAGNQLYRSCYGEQIDTKIVDEVLEQYEALASKQGEK